MMPMTVAEILDELEQISERWRGPTAAEQKRAGWWHADPPPLLRR